MKKNMHKIIFPSAVRIRVRKQVYLLLMAFAVAGVFVLLGLILKTIGG